MKVKLKTLLAGALVVALLACPAFAAQFPDVDENAEYAEAATFVSELGVMVGDNNGNFNPNNVVTRAEMAVIVCRMLGETEGLTTSAQFADVPADHWANPYVSKAAELGIINGYNGNFMPSDNVTYEQAIKMVVSSMGLSEVAENNGGYPDGFIAVADDYGYSKEVSANKGEALKRWQVAIMLYNCMGE